MDFLTFAKHMAPFWILGITIMGMLILAGQKHLLRIEKRAVWKWVKFLLLITAYRFIIIRLTGFSGFGNSANAITTIPLFATLTVFWEDACHGLPLLILRKLIGNNKWLKPIYFLALTLVMIEFGMGHLYQGFLAAVLLSFYIPYSINKGEQYGFGTIMLCHILYDFVTLFTVMYLIN